MKKKLQSLFTISFILLGFVFLNSSCTEEKYYYEEPTTIHFEPHIVKKNKWEWNSERNRYEAFVNFPGLTANMYDNGVLSASVFIPYKDYEIQTPLPYIETWEDTGGNIYTETISYDISLGYPGMIAFYIQSSDLGRDDSFLRDYEFKVSLIFYK